MSDFPASEINDLEIKKRARRRLVGATVLALLAVIVLPQIVKDDEAPRGESDMQVSIPEQGELESPQAVPENGHESARIDIEPDAASGESGLPDDLPPLLSDDVPPLLTEDVPPLLTGDNTSPEPLPTPPPPPPPPPERSVSPPPPVVKSSGEPRRESSRDTAKKAEATRALALLDGAAPAKEADRAGKTPAARAHGQVFVQVAAFSNASRAAKQAEELKKQGFDAYAEKAGKVTRVRIGPLSRSEGEKVVARLKAQGRSAVLSSK